jgi:RNA polymerase sigma-70 factor (ECF subfamily)
VPEETPFQDLVLRVRAGDEEAAAELLRRYEPVIRRMVRIRLVDGRLRRVLDSADICQSVMASFFVRAALGQYELATPDQLLRLLSSMARNKLIDQARRAHGVDDRRPREGTLDGEQLEGKDSSPSMAAAMRELLAEARKRLSAKDRQLLQLRESGLEWAEIAAQLGEGESAEALRKRLARAVDLVGQQLGLEA